MNGEPTPEGGAIPRGPQDLPRPHPPVRRMAICGPLLAVAFIASLIVLGVWRHVSMERGQREFATAMSRVVVSTVTVKRDDKAQELILPGNIQAFEQATLYARATGYIKRWLVDIGDPVKEGQLLAEIETPDIDQQLAQAQAQLRQQQSSANLARITAQRWQELANRLVVSKQENDQNQFANKQAQASLAAAQANVALLLNLQGFNRVTAPFDGKITRRQIDVGTLVTAGSGSTGTPLFDLAKTNPLRIYIDVPQTNAAAMEEGVLARILVPEYPGREFDGKVKRTAGAIDPTSRTLLTEVQIPNPEGTLFAGMYGQVKFALHPRNAPLLAPANTILFGPTGPQVAVVTQENQIHWQSIRIGRDLGTHLEVVAGLDENMRVVSNPSDDLQDGMTVEVSSGSTAH